MSYQIIAQRTITLDGEAVDHPTEHEAWLEGEDGAEMKLSLSGDGQQCLVAVKTDPEDYSFIDLADIESALSDLKRLHPSRPQPTAETDDISERAAQVVERACETLEEGSAYTQSLAVDLRATMLSLIERATRR